MTDIVTKTEELMNEYFPDDGDADLRKNAIAKAQAVKEGVDGAKAAYSEFMTETIKPKAEALEEDLREAFNTARDGAVTLANEFKKTVKTTVDTVTGTAADEDKTSGWNIGAGILAGLAALGLVQGADSAVNDRENRGFFGKIVATCVKLGLAAGACVAAIHWKAGDQVADLLPASGKDNYDETKTADGKTTSIKFKDGIDLTAEEKTAIVAKLDDAVKSKVTVDETKDEITFTGGMEVAGGLRRAINSAARQ